jgi:hypothetical protein
MTPLPLPKHTTMSPTTSTPPVLPTTAPGPSLNAVLLFDAATCAGMGLVLLALTLPIGTLLGLPAALLSAAGVLLLACAVPMLVAGRQQPPAAGLVMLIVIGNMAWALASVYVAVSSDGITTLGQVFVFAQALVVLVLAGLEWRALAARQTRR